MEALPRTTDDGTVCRHDNAADDCGPCREAEVAMLDEFARLARIERARTRRLRRKAGDVICRPMTATELAEFRVWDAAAQRRARYVR